VGFLRRERRVGRTHPRENEIRRKKLANLRKYFRKSFTKESLNELSMRNMVKIQDLKKKFLHKTS